MPGERRTSAVLSCSSSSTSTSSSPECSQCRAVPLGLTRQLPRLTVFSRPGCAAPRLVPRERWASAADMTPRRFSWDVRAGRSLLQIRCTYCTVSDASRVFRTFSAPRRTLRHALFGASSAEPVIRSHTNSVLPASCTRRVTFIISAPGATARS